jgi:hypothetical protein
MYLYIYIIFHQSKQIINHIKYFSFIKIVREEKKVRTYITRANNLLL